MSSQKKTSFFDRGFGKYVIPGIILQSVMIGGGYATGREIVQYAGIYGANGWISGLGTALTFAIVCALTFELVRLYKCYDYKSYIRTIAGPLWIVFDIVYVIFSILIIAVMAAATGSILNTTLGWAPIVGEVIIVAVAGILNFYGHDIIERFETFGTIALYVGFIIFAIIVITYDPGHIKEVFASNDTSYVEASKSGMGSVFFAGIIYAAYNLVVVPPTLNSIKRQTSTKESVVSGIIGGLLCVIPLFLTYFALMVFYPSDEVFGANVPWLVMMQNAGQNNPIIVGLFGIVVGWTLIETSTGIVRAGLDRVNSTLIERNKSQLSRMQQGIITLVILVAAIIFSQVGIIDLIAVGYNAMAYAFIVIMIIPLLTVGTYKIIRAHQGKPAATWDPLTRDKSLLEIGSAGSAREVSEEMARKELND